MESRKGRKSVALASVTPGDIENLFGRNAKKMHDKVDATRDAYFGFIFPIKRSDLSAVAAIFDISPEAERALYREGRRFSTFKQGGIGQLTNHIYGAATLALRGKSLDTGLSGVNDKTIGTFVRNNADAILDVADVRSSWFGRIYFPAQGFANAIGVFGGKVSPDALFAVAKKYDFAAEAGDRLTIRGDFGIAVWLTLLARAD